MALPGNGNGQVGLAGAGAANQDDVGLMRKKAALIEVSDLQSR